MTVPRAAFALDYPTRPVHLLVGYAAGGVNDIIARLTAQWLSRRLGQQFVVEDRPGAGSNLATEQVVRAAPDGYTLLEASSSNGFNAALYDKLSFDFIRDIAPVASTIRSYNVMEVTPSFPAKTVPDFIAYAKANPGKVNMASAGIGSTPQLYGELFKSMAGVDLVTVHYRGSGAALPDLIGGQCQVMFDSVVSSMAHIRSGALHALAVTSATRVDAFPDLPAIAEFVPGYEGTGWQGIGAPRNTPAEIVTALNEAINAGLADADFKARVDELGADVLPGSPSDFGRLIADYTEKWGKVIRAAGIKAE
ncbi:MAG TPA: tripartite tricarboxylate transporter substrate binding protein [Xanthobacteraceae bacterium]|nr:tripartite tricarboxylate transporter substrate binding protein [Xanthobacteraceae bacterium]